MTGVLLTRAQPIHFGHLEIIKKALVENDKVLVVIGSSNKSGTTRNPFTIELRLEMVTDFLESNGVDMSRVKIMPLADWSKEDAYEYAKEWGRFFYYNVVNTIQEKRFKFYYNDSESTVARWFEPEIAERIELVHSERKTPISSTRVRKAILENDKDTVDRYMGTSRYASEMRIVLKHSENEDFIMG